MYRFDVPLGGHASGPPRLIERVMQASASWARRRQGPLEDVEPRFDGGVMRAQELSRMISDRDNQLIRAWRRGELSESDAMQFEARLFVEPELLQAVEIDQSMASALNQGSHAVPALAPARRRRRMAQGAQLLLAASVGAVAVMPFMSDQSARQPAAQSIEWVSVSNMRATSDAVLVLQPDPEIDLIALDVAVEGQAAIDVALVDLRGGETGVHAEQLLPRDGAVGFAFQRHALPPGDYRLRLSREGRGQVAPDVVLRYQP